MQDDNKLEAFRKSLEKANYAVPDSATFAQTLSDPVKAEAFHKALVEEKYNVPEDYETFSSTLGLKKKDIGDYGLPSKEVFSEMFSSFLATQPEVSQRPPDPYDPEKFKTPDLTLKAPDMKGPQLMSLKDAVGEHISHKRIADSDHAAMVKEVEAELANIDKKLAALPKEDTDMLPAMNFSGGLILPTRPVSEEKANLLRQKNELKMAITKPDKLTYILGKAYNQSLIGLTDAIINGTPRAPEEWLQKYDANTLTDVTATALGFMLDMPFFGVMGKVGGTVGKAAAKPFVQRAMTKTVEKMVKAGIPEATAKTLALRGAAKTSQIISGLGSSATALGSYGAVGSALSDWAQPDADFDDIRWGEALKRGGKDFLLGAGVGGLGIASAAIASKASAIPSLTGRVGAKIGTAAGGLTAESALFSYGGALLDGRKPKDVTGKEFLETVALLGMLKISKAPQKALDVALEPKKAAVKIYQSLKYNPDKPGQGAFEVDIEPWEIEAIGGRDYKSAMEILAKNDAALGEIMKADDISAHLKQRFLWGSRGVGMEDIDFTVDKVVANGEYVEAYNKKGILLDKRKAPTKDDADQAALDLGLQLEDNKMQQKAAEPENRVKIISTLQKDGADIPKIVEAVDKPVEERTPEEHKIVGDYSKIVPSGDVKPPETPVKETWQMTRDEFWNNSDAPVRYGEANKEAYLSLHQVEVEKAIAEGKLVPGNVLAEYPELSKKKPAEKPEVKPEAPEKKTETKPVVQEKEDMGKRLRKGEKKKVKFGPDSPTGKILGAPAQDLNDSMAQFLLGGGTLDRADFIRHSGWANNDIINSGMGFFLSNKGAKFDGLHEIITETFGKEKGGEITPDEILDILGTFRNEQGKITRAAIIKRFQERHKDINQQDEKALSPEEREKRELDDDIVIDESRGELDDFIKQAEGDKVVEDALKAFQTEAGSGLLDWGYIKNKVKTEPNFFINNWLWDLNEAQIEKLNQILSSHGEQIRFETRIKESSNIKGEGEGDVIPGRTEEPPGEVGGKEKPAETEPKPKIDEKPNEPSTPISKREEPDIPAGPETVEKPPVAKGKEKPVRTTDAVKQKQIDAIDKEYDDKIVAQEAIIPRAEDDMRKALLDADERNGLFGDVRPVEKDEIIKRDEQGFEYSEKTRAAVRKPFEEKIAEAKKNIASLEKERESKIGEILKQQTLGFEETPKETEPAKTKDEFEEIRPKAEDIPTETARRAHMWTSFDPDKRGKQEQESYVKQVNDVIDEMSKLAKSEEQKAVLKAEIERYKSGLIAKTKAYLDAASRTASSMITGPSNFPTERNRKALAAADNRMNELVEWDKKAQAAIKKAILAARTPEEYQTEKWQGIKKKIDDDIATIIGLDTGKLKGYNRALFVTSLKGFIERMANNGQVEDVRMALDYIKKVQSELKKPIFAERNEVWNAANNAEFYAKKSEEKKQKGEVLVREYDGAKITNNYEAERVQISMDERPTPEVINALKKEGWKWSPSNSVWQRQNTGNAVRSAQSIMDKYFKTKTSAETEKPETKEYKYRMELRPFGIGTYPKEGFVKAGLTPGDKFETLTYNKKLTPEELSHWSFTPLTEVAELKGKQFIDKDGEFRVTLDWMKNDKGADVSMFDKEGVLVEKPFFMGTSEIMKNIESGYWKELPKKTFIVEPTPYGKAIQELRGAQERDIQELLDKTSRFRDAFKVTTAKELIDRFRHGSEWKKSGKNTIKSRATGMQEIEMFIKDPNTTPETRALMKELKSYFQNENKGWGLRIKDFENKPDKPESFADSKTAKQNKKYKNEPKTDKPEELAWDQPLPLSPAEDPNFKNSDLNNAMSIRNLARNLIKNMGMEEGADIRVGFIKRFARKARGIFNPVSGVIRVRSIRDLRALTHEIGHKLDFEIFDIRGIISAKKSDPGLGAGVDFNGRTYSDVAQVEKAMKFHAITIDEGNFLLDKVRKFEKLRLAEKYSEIIEQGTPVGVKYKNKTYKSVKEINDALANNKIKAAKAAQLIVKFNTLNKNLPKQLDRLRAKYGDDAVAGVLQRNVLKKEFRQLLRDIGYPSEKREEGIAEFVYNYVIDPKQLINSTPTALAWFEKMLDNAPEIKNALHSLRQEFAEYDAQDIKTKLAAEVKPKDPEKPSWLDTIVKLGSDPMYNVVNMLRPLEVRVNKWKVMMDNNTLAYKDPWVSAKQMLGQGGRSEQWILYHPYFNRGNDVVIRKDLKGLMPILKPIIGTNDYLHYQTYLVALDAIESHNRGKSEQAYFDLESAIAGRAAYEKQYGAAKLREFQSDIQNYNEALLDFAAESGIISKETAQYWKQEHQHYVPLRRIAETYEVMGGRGKTITRDLLPEAERAIFSRRGSEKQLRDIFESMIENTNHILAASERNLLNRNLADMFFDIHNYNKAHNKGGAVIEEIDARGMEAYQDPTTGEIRYAIKKVRPKNFRPPKGRIMVVSEEGVKRFYDVAPEYYDDIFRVTNKVAKDVSKVMKVLSAPSRWLQAGAVVYDPTFPVRNIFRDQTSTWFTSKHGYLPTDFLRGLSSAIKRDDFYQKWLASGGDQSFLVSADQAITNNYYDKKLGKFAQRKFDAYKRNPFLALQDFSKASEIGTRLGAFKNAYKRTNNVRLAAIESRDITADYGIHGAMTRQAFSMYPFLNARIQWARTMAESMKNPSAFMLKGMALTIPAAINWLINNQDEESKNLYQSLPTWRRVGMFNIRIPGTDHFLPLPKGFYGVLFASSVESMLDAATKDDPRVLKELPQQLFKEISPISNWPEVIPFIGRPLIEAWANKKGFTGKPIVSESMKLLKPSEQFYNSTPEIIKKMGEALNWSPVKIQHYFSSYTGGAGMGAVNILDEVLQATGLVEKKPEDTFTMLSRMPVFKALLTEKPIGLSSGYISDFYDTLDKIEKVNVTFNNFVKTDNMDGLEKFMSDPENKRMYSFYEGNSTALNSFRSALTFARNNMYAVMKDETLTMKEKQAEVQRINDVIQETALKFKDAYEKQEFFNYSKAMDEIVTKMKEDKKDYRKELMQQQNAYNPYWMQLREKNKDIYDRLKEYGGLRDIEQTRSITQGGTKVVLELEDVRRFNETVVQRYGENVKNMIGTNSKLYESYQSTITPTTENPEMTQLKQLLDSAWEMAMAQTKADFKPTYTNEK